jgi:hypothetical protein
VDVRRHLPPERGGDVRDQPDDLVRVGRLGVNGGPVRAFSSARVAHKDDLGHIHLASKQTAPGIAPGTAPLDPQAKVVTDQGGPGRCPRVVHESILRVDAVGRDGNNNVSLGSHRVRHVAIPAVAGDGYESRRAGPHIVILAARPSLVAGGVAAVQDQDERSLRGDAEGIRHLGHDFHRDFKLAVRERREAVR